MLEGSRPKNVSTNLHLCRKHTKPETNKKIGGENYSKLSHVAIVCMIYLLFLYFPENILKGHPRNHFCGIGSGLDHFSERPKSL